MFAYGNGNSNSSQIDSYNQRALGLLRLNEQYKNDIANTTDEAKKKKLERERQKIINELRQIRNG
jgi:hypothetical protein